MFGRGQDCQVTEEAPGGYNQCHGAAAHHCRGAGVESAAEASTTTSVSMCLTGLSIPAARVCSVLKNMKKHWGCATKTFTQSARTFRLFVAGLDKSTLSNDFLETEPSIRWVVKPLLSAPVSLKPQFLYITSDATRNLELMGYRYGLVCVWNGLLHALFSVSSPQQTFLGGQHDKQEAAKTKHERPHELQQASMGPECRELRSLRVDSCSAKEAAARSMNTQTSGFVYSPR